MTDIGLTHVALPIRDAERSISFWSRYAGMQVVHRRHGESEDREVVWLSDRTRPFVIVLIEADEVDVVLAPIAHLGVGCPTREDVDRLAALAGASGCLVRGPEDSGYPVGYWAFLRDPDGHILELSHGQEVGLAVADPGQGID
ncbi:MAG: VOC family protein [Planctomycetes bacterium]|nr:VOC family protein [Planctomycetota bacterium]